MKNLTIALMIICAGCSAGNNNLTDKTIPIRVVNECCLLEGTTTAYSLGTCVEYLEDKENQYGLDNILDTARIRNQFKKNNSSIPDFGPTRSVYWFRFMLKNNSSHEKWFLELKNPKLQKINLFYSQSPDYKTFRLTRAGTMYPFEYRDIRSEHFIFSVTIKTGESKLFFLRINYNDGKTNQERMLLPLLLRANHKPPYPLPTLKEEISH